MQIADAIRQMKRLGADVTYKKVVEDEIKDSRLCRGYLYSLIFKFSTPYKGVKETTLYITRHTSLSEILKWHVNILQHIR